MHFWAHAQKFLVPPASTVVRRWRYECSPPILFSLFFGGGGNRNPILSWHSCRPPRPWRRLAAFGRPPAIYSLPFPSLLPSLPRLEEGVKGVSPLFKIQSFSSPPSQRCFSQSVARMSGATERRRGRTHCPRLIKEESQERVSLKPIYSCVPSFANSFPSRTINSP